MDMRAVYELELQVRIEGDHLDLVRDPKTTASAIKGAVREALPFFAVKKIKVRCKEI